MQIIAKKKFADVIDMVCLALYTYDISQTKGKKMATNYTTLKLTENEMQALIKWVEIGRDEDSWLEDSEGKKRVKALESIMGKIEKEGWE
jgi:hypothetical protein